MSFNMHAIDILIFENGVKCQEKYILKPISIDVSSTVEYPGRHIPVPDDVFVAQVLAGRFIRRPVNEPKLLGPVQDADLLDLAVGLDQPSFRGKLKIKTHALLGGVRKKGPNLD